MNKKEERALKIIKDQIGSQNFINETLNWSEDAFNDYFDFRDSELFENDWLSEFNKIKELEKGKKLPLTIIDEIREMAFLKVYKLTQNHELSAYISDDFELITKNIILELERSFINKMWDNYKNGGLAR